MSTEEKKLVEKETTHPFESLMPFCPNTVPAPVFSAAFSVLWYAYFL